MADRVKRVRVTTPSGNDVAWQAQKMIAGADKIKSQYPDASFTMYGTDGKARTVTGKELPGALKIGWGFEPKAQAQQPAKKPAQQTAAKPAQQPAQPSQGLATQVINDTLKRGQQSAPKPTPQQSAQPTQPTQPTTGNRKSLRDNLNAASRIMEAGRAINQQTGQQSAEVDSPYMGRGYEQWKKEEDRKEKARRERRKESLDFGTYAKDKAEEDRLQKEYAKNSSPSRWIENQTNAAADIRTKRDEEILTNQDAYTDEEIDAAAERTRQMIGRAQERDMTGKGHASEVSDAAKEAAFSRQTAQDRENIAAYLQPRIDKRVDTAQGEIDKRLQASLDAMTESQWRQIEGLSNVGSMYGQGTIQGAGMTERNITMDRMMQPLMNDLDKTIQEMFDPEDIVADAKASGVDLNTYFNQFASKVADRISETAFDMLVKRNLPKSALEYLIGKVNQSVTGSVINALTRSAEQKQVAAQAEAMVDSGENPYYKPGKATKFLGTMMPFMADAPYMKAVGVGVEAALPALTRAEAASQAVRLANKGWIGRMGVGVGRASASTYLNFTGYNILSTVAGNAAIGEKTTGQHILEAAVNPGALIGATGTMYANAFNRVGITGLERNFGRQLVNAGKKLAVTAGAVGTEASAFVLGDWLLGKRQDLQFVDFIDMAGEVIAMKFGGLVNHATGRESIGDSVGKMVKASVSLKHRLNPEVRKEIDRNRGSKGFYDYLDEIFRTAQDKTLTPDARTGIDAIRKKNLLDKYNELVSGLSWDAENALNIALWGVGTKARPRMARFEEREDGIYELDKDGNVLSVNYTKDEGEREAFRELKESQRDQFDVINLFQQAHNKGIERIMSLDPTSEEFTEYADEFIDTDEKAMEMSRADVVRDMQKPDTEIGKRFRGFLADKTGVVDVLWEEGLTPEDWKRMTTADPYQLDREDRAMLIRLMMGFERLINKPGELNPGINEESGRRAAEQAGAGTDNPNEEGFKAVSDAVDAAKAAFDDWMKGGSEEAEIFAEGLGKGDDITTAYMNALRNGATEEQLSLVANYINALSRQKGFMDAAQDKINESANRFGQMVTHRKSGSVHIMVDATGKEWYIINGEFDYDQYHTTDKGARINITDASGGILVVDEQGNTRLMRGKDLYLKANDSTDSMVEYKRKQLTEKNAELLSHGVTPEGTPESETPTGEKPKEETPATEEETPTGEPETPATEGGAETPAAEGTVEEKLSTRDILRAEVSEEDKELALNYKSGEDKSDAAKEAYERVRAAIKTKADEEARLKAEEEERKRQEEAQRQKEEEERRRQEEEQRKREEEERLKAEEEERKRKEEEERKRKEEEERRRKEEEERLKSLPTPPKVGETIVDENGNKWKVRDDKGELVLRPYERDANGNDTRKLNVYGDVKYDDWVRQHKESEGSVKARTEEKPKETKEEKEQKEKKDWLSKVVEAIKNGYDYSLIQKAKNIQWLAEVANEVHEKNDTKASFAVREYITKLIGKSEEDVLKMMESAPDELLKAIGAGKIKNIAHFQALIDTLGATNEAMRKSLRKAAEPYIAKLKDKAKREIIGKVREGTATIEEIEELYYALADGTRSEEVKTLAQKVFSLLKGVGVDIKISDVFDKRQDIIGQAWGGRVRYRLQYLLGNTGWSNDGEKAVLLLHELIHTATVYAYDMANKTYKYTADQLNAVPPERKKAMQEAVQALDEIHNTIKRDRSGIFNTIKTSWQKSKYYGMTNTKEMIAEMANPYFRDALKQKNLWDKFKNSVMKLLGIDNKDDAHAENAVSKALDMLLDNFDEGLWKAYDERIRKIDPNWKEGETPTETSERIAAEERMRRYDINEKEDKRRQPIRKKINEISKLIGVKVRIHETADTVTNKLALNAIKRGVTVKGWYEENGELALYIPNLKDAKAAAKTYFHEVVGHYGLKRLFDKKGAGEWDKFLDHVWNSMTQKQKNRFWNYEGVQKTKDLEQRRRKAADEFMAKMTEDTLGKGFWDKALDIVKRVLGVKDIEAQDLKEAVLASYKNLQGEAVSPEVREAADNITEKGGQVDAEKGDAMFAVADILDDKEYRKAVKELMKVTGRSERTVRKYLDAEKSLAKIILDEDNVALLDMQVDESVPSIWKNSDYPQGTVEFSNICRKRLPFTLIYQRLQREFPNMVIDAKTLESIRGIMKEAGSDVACGLCFVEDRRQLLGEIGQSFIDMLKGEKTDVNDNQVKAHEKLIQSGDKYIPNLYELLTLDGMKGLRKAHPAVAQAFIEYNSARGMQAGRLFQAYSAYHREILDYSKAKVKSINDNGGLRIFSFSDFEAHHLIDLVQVLTDCAVKGIKVQGYTKVPEFARAVKDTGMKLNRSLIAKAKGVVDADYVPQEGEAVSPNVINGKRLLFDTIEGIDVNHPDFFDSTGNRNVGNIVVGISDEHIQMAMLDPFVDYIIPFHSGLSEAIRQQKGIGDWVNYKLVQLEKKYNEAGKLVNADKHGINIYTDVLPRGMELIGKEIKNVKDFQLAFFKACAEKGWIPRFSKFINTNKKGEYVYTPGYDKLLIDFKLFDKNGRLIPQEVVQPIFDNDYNKKILDDYVRDMKESGTGVTDELYNKVKEGLGLGSGEGKTMLSVEENKAYMDAAEKGDEKTAAEMVREAVKKAMPKTKVVDEEGNPMVVYHGTNKKFTTFKKGKGIRYVMGLPIEEDAHGFFFADTKDDASQHGKNIMGVYLNMQNPILDKPLREGTSEYNKAVEDIWYVFSPIAHMFEEGWNPNATRETFERDHEYFALKVGLSREGRDFDHSAIDWECLDDPATEEVVSRMRELGYDGFRVDEGTRENGERELSWFAIDPEQIKSADPITRDDNGNIIPLSERFNPENKDIRFSVEEDSEEIKPIKISEIEVPKRITSQAQASQWAYETLGKVRGILTYFYGDNGSKDFSMGLLSTDPTKGREMDIENAKYSRDRMMQYLDIVQPKLYEARDNSTSEDVKNYFQELIDDCNYSRQWYDRAAEGDTSIFDEARTRFSVEDNGDVRYSADDKRKTYGAPYQGSKNRIARRLIDLLPKGNRFVDLFSGGGAMTHAAIESGKYGSQHMNDIDDAGMRLFLDGASGKWNGRKLEPISDEEFAALKEKDRPEAILRSVMAKGQTMARNDGERDRANEQLARVQSLNGLDVSKVKTSVGDYRKVELKKGDVVYCDIPYEKTHQDGYKGKPFDKKEFDEWAQKQKGMVFVSEFSMPEGWTEIASFDVVNKGKRQQEKLWVQSKFAEQYFEETGRTHFSVDEKTNKSYLDAVKKDDTETVSRMVREAAKAAGMATDEKGEPIELYHGTGKFGFTIFDKLKTRVGAFFTTTKRNVSANYGGRDDRYAGVRKINQGYVEDNTTEGVLKNAKSVLDQDWRLPTDEEKNAIVEKVEAEAKKVADKLDTFVDKVDEFPKDDELDIFNAAAWVGDLFYTVAYAKENGNEGAELYRLVSDGVEKYEENKQIVRDYLLKHYDELNDGQREYLNYLTHWSSGDVEIDISGSYKDILSGEELGTVTGESMITIDKLRDAVEFTHNVGSYHLYGDLGDNPLIVDAGGKNWYSLEYEGRKYDTDTLAKYAKENGYTSLVVKNVYDYGDMADDYVFFEPEQIKSADPVTYDDKGNPIPLSKRFDKSNPDIRFSVEEPSREYDADPLATASRIAKERIKERREKRINPDPIPRTNPYREIINDPDATAEERKTLFSVTPGKYDTLTGAEQKRRYDDAVKKSGFFSWREAWVDRLASLKDLCKALTGVKNIDDLKDVHNVYRKAVHLSSVVQAAQEKALDEFGKPLVRAIDSCIKKVGGDRKKAYDKVHDYLWMKSGLERNRVLRVRDNIDAERKKPIVTDADLGADAHAIFENLKLNFNWTGIPAADIPDIEAGLARQAQQQWCDELMTEWKERRRSALESLENGTIDLREYFEDLDSWISNYWRYTAGDKRNDYAALHIATGGYTADDKYDDAKVIQDVMDMEDLLGDAHKELWNQVRRMTGESLRRSYESGNTSKALYEHISEMMDWYVPMRKWKEDTAEDINVYFISPRSEQAGDNIVMRAKGKQDSDSQSEDVIATMMQMLDGSIANGEANKMKQALYRLANATSTQDSGLISQGLCWLEKTGKKDSAGNDIWELRVADTNDTMTPAEVAQAVADFEEDMKQKAALGNAMQVKGDIDVPYRFEKALHKNEHAVIANINGVRHVMYINGDPRAAQALNGQINASGKGTTTESIQHLNRYLAAAFTSWSPKFVLRNVVRDADFSRTNVFAKEGWKYTFGKNGYIRNWWQAMATMGGPKGLWARYHNGTLGTTGDDKYFAEFMANGGKTGYVAQKQIDEYKNALRNELDNLREDKGVGTRTKDMWHFMTHALEGFNNWAENISRFAVYKTSRQHGRSMLRAVADAKDATTNFNVKGAYGGTARNAKTWNARIAGGSAEFFNDLYIFMNPAIQSLALTARNFKAHPVRASLAYTMHFLWGAAWPAIASYMAGLWNPEDEDADKKYALLPPWSRNSSVCIPLGGDDWLSLPLAIETSGAWEMGQMFAAQMWHPELQSDDSPIVKYGSLLTKLLPINPLNSGGKDLYVSLAPTVLAPIVQNMRNAKWTGLPIEKEKTQWNKNDAAWTRALPSTSPLLVSICKGLSDLTSAVGDSEVEKGWLDLSPGKIQNLISGYTGGIGTLFMDVATLAKNTASGEFDASTLPVVNGLYVKTDKKNADKSNNARWWTVKNAMDGKAKSLKTISSKKDDADPTSVARYEAFEGKWGDMVASFKAYEKEIKQWEKLAKETTDEETAAVYQQKVDQLKMDAYLMYKEGIDGKPEEEE